MSESYTIEIWRSPDRTDATLLRTSTSTSPDGAETVIESMIDTYGYNEEITWAADEPDQNGYLHGHSDRDDLNYAIVVKPPLVTAQ